jgi:hypothetical protein
MGAPEEVDRPFVAAVDTLAAPLVISDKSKIAFPKDPVAQRIWSTLDEADEIAPDEAAQLAPWLKLSHGRDGLWAYRLGCLIASERASIPGALWKLPLIDSAQALASSAPLSTPQYMIDALQDVANEAKAHELMPDCLHTLDHAAATLFGSPRS